MDKPRKFRVQVWATAPGQGVRYRERGAGYGMETVGLLWSREYRERSSVNRAAPGLRRRFPTASIEVTPFEFDGFLFWMQVGPDEVL